MTFAEEPVLVIGLGRSGQACVEVLRARGLAVYAIDEKPPAELGEAIALVEAQGARFVPRLELDGVLKVVRAAVVSPGVPLTGDLMRRVHGAHVPVYSEIEVAYRLCRAPIVAVTGTKGKSTTTALVGHLFRACGIDTRIGGNIGNPLIREVIDVPAASWVAAEVSSFQLESIRSFRPRVSVILNLSADHLDRYHSMDEYAEAKYRIFTNQNERDFFVGNLDDGRLAALHWHTGERRIHARQLWFTMSERHDYATMYLRGDALVYAPIAGDPRPVEIMRRGDIPLAGDHNVQNVMAALLAALAAGLPKERLREGVNSFTALAHRQSPVAEADGVLFVDDSKATNPGSVIAALHAYDRPIILIAGGRSKNTGFTELGAAVDERAKALIAIGEAADELARAVHRVPVHRAASMEEAVQTACRLAQRGDVVLLSPACASFDMFLSAEDRGAKFCSAVRAFAGVSAR